MKRIDDIKFENIQDLGSAKINASQSVSQDFFHHDELVGINRRDRSK